MQGLKLLIVIALIRGLCLLFIREDLVRADLWPSALMAFRFDWLVLSFILIVPWLNLVAMEFLPIPFPIGEFFVTWSWRLLSGAALSVWLVNIFYFSHQHEWMWLAPWKERLNSEFTVTTALAICTFLALLLFRNSKLLFWRVALRNNPSKRSVKSPRIHGKSNVNVPQDRLLKRVGVVIATALLIAVGARGTFTPHHLRFEHSLVSKNAHLNAWVLSPLWTLNKDR